MFKYSVVIYTTNQQGGISATVTLKDTQKEAEDLFFDKLSQLGGNQQTRFVRVELKNEDGEMVDFKVRKNEPIEAPTEE